MDAKHCVETQDENKSLKQTKEEKKEKEIKNDQHKTSKSMNSTQIKPNMEEEKENNKQQDDDGDISMKTSIEKKESMGINDQQTSKIPYNASKQTKPSETESFHSSKPSEPIQFVPSMIKNKDQNESYDLIIETKDDKIEYEGNMIHFKGQYLIFEVVRSKLIQIKITSITKCVKYANDEKVTLHANDGTIYSVIYDVKLYQHCNYLDSIFNDTLNISSLSTPIIESKQDNDIYIDERIERQEKDYDLTIITKDGDNKEYEGEAIHFGITKKTKERYVIFEIFDGSLIRIKLDKITKCIKYRNQQKVVINTNDNTIYSLEYDIGDHCDYLDLKINGSIPIEIPPEYTLQVKPICICGGKLTLCNGHNIQCNICHNNFNSNEYIYRCQQNRRCNRHPNGYDLCMQCATNKVLNDKQNGEEIDMGYIEDINININEEKQPVFIWKIPSNPDNRTILLCLGIIRESGIFIDFHNDIILLLTRYFCDEYSLIEIQKICKCHLERFVSPIFEYKNIKWCFELTPNGYKQENKGRLILLLCIASIPSEIKQFTATFSVFLQETKTMFEETTVVFNNNNKLNYQWPAKYTTFKQIENLHQLTFKLYLKIHGQQNNNNDNSMGKILRLLPLKYEWKIKDKETICNIKKRINVHAFKSAIFKLFGFKWSLTIWPNGSRVSRQNQFGYYFNIYLNLVSIPYSNIEIMTQINLYCIELKTVYSEMAIYNEYEISHGSKWLFHENDLNDINDTLTFVANIKLIDVKQRGKQFITNKYITNSICNEIDNIPLRKYQISIPINHIDGEKRKFELYGLKWSIQFQDDHGFLNSNLCVNIWDIAISNVILSIRFTLIASEINMRYITPIIFTNNNYEHQWGDDRLSMSKLRKLYSFQFQIIIELIDIYHKGKSIKNQNLPKQVQYNNYNEYKAQIPCYDLSLIQSQEESYNLFIKQTDNDHIDEYEGDSIELEQDEYLIFTLSNSNLIKVKTSTITKCIANYNGLQVVVYTNDNKQYIVKYFVSRHCDYLDTKINELLSSRNMNTNKMDVDDTMDNKDNENNKCNEEKEDQETSNPLQTSEPIQFVPSMIKNKDQDESYDLIIESKDDKIEYEGEMIHFKGQYLIFEVVHSKLIQIKITSITKCIKYGDDGKVMLHTNDGTIYSVIYDVNQHCDYLDLIFNDTLNISSLSTPIQSKQDNDNKSQSNDNGDDDKNDNDHKSNNDNTDNKNNKDNADNDNNEDNMDIDE